MNDRVTASSLSDNELAQAISDLVAARWDDWDLSPFFAYLVDVCAPAALPFLAEQFDIDGIRGFEMAGDEEQQRGLIKRSIGLHKFIGTPWAIREACATIGFPVVLLEEGATAHGAVPKLTDWAQFRVLLEADINRHITEDEARKLRLFVEYYKNERSHLVELGFHQSLSETLFRPAAEGRDGLEVEVLTLEISPNPAVLNPRGDEICVTVRTNARWTLPSLVYWGDNTDDKINVSAADTPGESRIAIVSDPNTTARDREVALRFETPSGIVLGILTVRQLSKWRNAYSHAYSRAYNEHSPQPPFLELKTQTVWLEPTADFDEQIELKSNTNWEVN